MSKDFEELEILINKTGCMNDTCAHLGDCLKDNKCRYNDDNLMCPDYKMAKTLKDDLTELKAIKESNPSEALECVKRIRAYFLNRTREISFQDLRDIEQALLKSQEQEKVFEIMKDKWVNVAVLIHSKTVEEYNNNAYTPYNLTQEEFELLKRYCDRKESE